MTQSADAYPDSLDGLPAPLQPADVKPVLDADIAYIMDGDGYGSGGHRSGTGLPRKTEFPASWTDGTVREAVDAALRSPGVPRSLQITNSGVELRAFYADVVIALPIMLFPDGWELMTAYPISGEGVYKNTRQGRAHVALNVDDLTRILDL